MCMYIKSHGFHFHRLPFSYFDDWVFFLCVCVCFLSRWCHFVHKSVGTTKRRIKRCGKESADITDEQNNRHRHQLQKSKQRNHRCGITKGDGIISYWPFYFSFFKHFHVHFKPIKIGIPFHIRASANIAFGVVQFSTIVSPIY